MTDSGNQYPQNEPTSEIVNEDTFRLLGELVKEVAESNIAGLHGARGSRYTDAFPDGGKTELRGNDALDWIHIQENRKIPPRFDFGPLPNPPLTGVLDTFYPLPDDVQHGSFPEVMALSELDCHLLDVLFTAGKLTVRYSGVKSKEDKAAPNSDGLEGADISDVFDFENLGVDRTYYVIKRVSGEQQEQEITSRIGADQIPQESLNGLIGLFEGLHQTINDTDFRWGSPPERVF